MAPENWARVISAAVVPLVMISAYGLLCLAFYNRLTAVLIRIRALPGESLKEQEELFHRTAQGDTQGRVRRLTRGSVEVLQRQMNGCRIAPDSSNARGPRTPKARQCAKTLRPDLPAFCSHI